LDVNLKERKNEQTAHPNATKASTNVKKNRTHQNGKGHLLRNHKFKNKKDTGILTMPIMFICICLKEGLLAK
jgi:hypothetical protein